MILGVMSEQEGFKAPDGTTPLGGVVPTPIQLEEEQGAAGVHAGTTRVDRLLKERIRRNRSHQLFDYDEASYDGPLDFLNGESSASERLVVVANRLPVTCSKDQHGHWQLQVSAGGLVSALKGVSTYTTMWIGWPGIWVKPGRERDALTAMLVQEGCIPVWIDPTLLDMYYNGFCNSVLWQLFHYVPLNIDSWQKMSEHRAMQMQWQAYQVANQRFADVVLENYLPNDIMWIQDYHLMVLPSLLKAVVPKMKVGFFLHTPFPSSEMYRTLPVREEVLRAVLGADLIGFHTYDYARHFISSCTRILGLEGTPEGVENNGTICRVGTFPIGIDPERFTHALETDEVQSHVAKLLNRYAGRKIMLGVDRLDMVKGIPQKLLAFEKFLEEHPEWRDKVLLVQIAVPSRTDVSEYQKLRSMVHEIVGRINGQFGTLTYVPIYHLDTSLSFTELCALYAVTDVALVTSLRDGMNLVSYEYVACQSDNAGVLVLSEFAGAAQSLGAGAILVNPWNITDMAQAIEDSLCMSEEERRERHRQNYMHVQTHTAQHWADTFISELNDTHIEADLRMKHAPPPLNMQEVVQAYKSSSKRLIVLGYNATLTTNTDAPIGRVGGLGTKRTYQEQLGKSQAKVNPKILASLQELSRDPNNVLVIFSGSETHKLEEIFGDLPVWLAAENGVFVRPPPQHLTPLQQSKRPWRALFHGISKEWMESVQLVFDYFCERTPRSSVEVRETSLVWNYKYADVEFGRIQARDLLQHLWTGPISNAPVEIIQGGKSVEVRPVSVTKGMSTQRMIGLMADVYGIDGVTFDFVLCVGHLLGRDENMYSFFEGVKVEGAAGTGAAGDGRKGGTGAPTLPAATQVRDQKKQEKNRGGRRWSQGKHRSTHAACCNTEPKVYCLTDVAHSRAAEALLDQDTLRACSASAPPHRDSHMLPRQPGVSEPGVSSSHSFHGRVGKSWGGAQDWDSRRDCPSTPASSDSGHVFRRDGKQPYEQELPDCFPPPFLFTCTVGRNRSKARYALSAASEVSDLLDSIVQQAIYNQQPPTLPAHPCGADGLSPGPHYAQGGMDPNSRIQSFSSTEPLSPDSMFTLINSWKNFRTAGTGTTTPVAAGTDCPLPPSALPPLAAGGQHVRHTCTASPGTQI
ncbi:glycosyltransferase family 20-domain-containing protein [Dunaliella salina]|uniref:alpha,alpha-trehalose-phosphate synthase (UDP-forming) n=1 Tax=Dunaliella salina TaxID=3046 RepID=A0ABQ7FXK4_DUNSA|nr:glycosyltransferase family 20-domain-containing protein [Dunaliella salina]|eukprot:KAF5827092.1 glycosyltransferase family 20-domain-containing protein [Dunaliella salina]